MPFRGHCIDLLSRGSDLQFDSRPMEIYGAVNLIDSALTSLVASCARECQILKKLARGIMASPVRVSYGAMTRRERGAE